MANHEYRPHPPVQSLTINLHVAEVLKRESFRFTSNLFSKLPMMSTKLYPSLAS